MSVNAELLRSIEAIESRSSAYSFRFVQNYLKQNNMPSGVGWEPLKRKYENLSAEGLEEYKKLWHKLYRNSVFYSRRAIAIYSPDEETMTEIVKCSKELVVDSAYETQYPYSLAEPELKTQSERGVFIRHRVMSDGSIRLIACAKRSFTERESVEVGDLVDSAAQERLSGFDELIGVRRGLTQAFDIVIIRPEEGRIEIHIDLICRLAREKIDCIVLYYLDQLTCLLPQEKKELLGNCVKNLFPLIRAFYSDQTGVVSSLGHATGTNSLKEERMRSKRQDLRDEVFHKEGISAIRTTDPYSISIGWGEGEARHTPTIVLAGTSLLSGTASPFLGYAILEQCASRSDYMKLMGKLV